MLSFTREKTQFELEHVHSIVFDIETKALRFYYPSVRWSRGLCVEWKMLGLVSIGRGVHAHCMYATTTDASAESGYTTGFEERFGLCVVVLQRAFRTYWTRQLSSREAILDRCVRWTYKTHSMDSPLGRWIQTQGSAEEAIAPGGGPCPHGCNCNGCNGLPSMQRPR